MSLNFNYYGLLIGIATVVAIWWWEKRLALLNIRLKSSNRDLFLILFFTVCGARIWHLLTDWQLYVDDLGRIFTIWQGGLSILGALVGLMIGLFFVSKLEKINYFILLDITALTLPFAQAIGRWGNYLNQELYGLPADLPWSIMVNGQKVHPLFLYESILMLLLGLFLNMKFEKNRVGLGKYFYVYLVVYLSVRFLLDFLRVQKTMFNEMLGVNQVIILVILLVMLVVWQYKKIYGKKH